MARDSQMDDGRIRQAQMDAETKEGIDTVRVDLRRDMRELETRLLGDFREEGIKTRRHFDVVAESLRDDIRLIVGGLVTLDAKVEAIRRA